MEVGFVVLVQDLAGAGSSALEVILLAGSSLPGTLTIVRLLAGPTALYYSNGHIRVSISSKYRENLIVHACFKVRLQFYNMR